MMETIWAPGLAREATHCRVCPASALPAAALRTRSKLGLAGALGAVSATMLPRWAVASAVSMASFAFIASASVSSWRVGGVAALDVFQVAVVVTRRRASSAARGGLRGGPAGGSDPGRHLAGGRRVGLLGLLGLRHGCLRAGLREPVRAGDGLPRAEQLLVEVPEGAERGGRPTDERAARLCGCGHLQSPSSVLGGLWISGRRLLGGRPLTGGRFHP